jgi:hypothetical protein
MFDGATDTRRLLFSRGAFEEDPIPLRRGLYLPDFTREQTTGPFIRSLREICETVFDILLSAYASSVKAQFDRYTEQLKPKDYLDNWENSLNFAEEAQEAFRDAETKRTDDRTGANQAVQNGLALLKQRCDCTYAITIESHLTCFSVWGLFQLLKSRA